MALYTYGINYKSAPISIREKIAFSENAAVNALRTLVQNEAVNEAVLLTTCNRTEVITEADTELPVQAWFSDNQKLNNIDIHQYCYQHQDLAAVRHLIRVACGLDSMMLGEPQILGQIKQAYLLACEAGTVGKTLGQLFPAIFAASKEIRTKTSIGRCPVSIAYSITQLAKRFFQDITKCRALLIGAGHIIELVATHLTNCEISKLFCANRTLERAEKLAKQNQGKAIELSEMSNYIKECDIIISATGSETCIFNKETLRRAISDRADSPMLIVDLAVPRDIDPACSELANVSLYNIDDLREIIMQNMNDRKEAAKQAEAMIEMQAAHYMQRLNILDVSDLICRYRNRVERLRNEELNKALSQLNKGQSPEEVMKSLVNNLTNKIMHMPTVKLREAAYHQQFDTLLLIEKLFDL